MKLGSRADILMVIMDERVPSRARLMILALVLLSPTTENTLSASASERGNASTSFAVVASLINIVNPVSV